VYDSLVVGGPLVGAVVEVVELGRSTTTDARGVFRIDSVPGGRYRLAYSHQTLTAIGFVPPELPFTIGAGIDVSIILATPSPAAIYRRLCPGPKESATGVVLGTVREAATDTLLPGAEVRGDWTETTVSRVSGTTRRPRVVRSAVDQNGRFQLCGIPTDVPVLLQMISGQTLGPPLELTLADKMLAVRHLSLDLSPPSEIRRAGLVGVVKTAGIPIADVQVGLIGSNRIARTRADGSFRIDSVAAGTHTLEARAIGYSRQRIAVDLKPGPPATVTLSLNKAPLELPELTVAASAAATARTGFEQRRLRGVGGHFITREDIVRRGSIRVEDLFKGVPGMKVDPIGANDYQILSLRGGAGTSAVCSPTIYIDNIRIPLDPDIGNNLPVQPDEIQGIEIHQSPHSAPIEYRPMGQNCGIILIWTRRGSR
jgi:Carboxypeptidase regulatory-like domain/TonB-dependent Receptor Plug Domain